jgi:hypothetical protein
MTAVYACDRRASIVPVAAHELFTGCAATNAVKLSVTQFGTDQGFDHVNAADAVDQVDQAAIVNGRANHVNFTFLRRSASGRTSRMAWNTRWGEA